jgi:DNA helicase-2/ATP-dependent DNA helicase PcrA
MLDYSEYLNPEQLEVVMADGGPMLVIAGAGSGKTRTLIYRVARVIESGVPPERVLLATFTNKAARTMLSRVEALLDIDVKRLWGGTFHHLGNRILRKYGHLLGYERSFTILDQEDSGQLVNACIAELNLEATRDKFPKGKIVHDIISYGANTKATVEHVVTGRYPYFCHCVDDICTIDRLYQERKQELNMMDFDDLLLKVRELLVDFPEVRDEYSGRFMHVLVDEYQDTNIIQADILDMLASHHRNIMVVGDDSQSIYSFRGADFSNIFRFPERYPDTKVFKLETNYRSTPEILHVANRSILNNENQFQKELRPVRQQGIRPVYVPLRNVMQQADFVSQRILELLDDGTALGDIAVLYRAHYHSMELQMELTRRGIPFEIRSGIRFFEQAHIKDVTSFLKILQNPFDELAWKRILKLYKRVGKATADKVWKFVAQHTEPFDAVLSDEFPRCASKSVTPALEELQGTLDTVVNLYRNGEATAGITHAVLDSGYRDIMREKYSDVGTREEDIMQLATFSAKFDALEDFLSELALLTGITEDEETYAADDSRDRVVLGSIHQAKGLEWSTVFIIWCSEGMLPLARALREEGGEDEERRLFYVAITRAMDRLYFCHPLMDYTRGMGNTVLPPSRFLRELETSYMDPDERPFDQWVVDEF